MPILKKKISLFHNFAPQCWKSVKPHYNNNNLFEASAEDSNSSSSSSDTSSESSDSESDDDDDSSGSSSSSSSEDDNENMSSSDISQLIETCVAGHIFIKFFLWTNEKLFFIGLEICIVRLTLNYKALYRLAHLYFNYKTKKDLTKCKQLLLGEYVCKDGSVVSGLFSDRKATNFFNVSNKRSLKTSFLISSFFSKGIWRIPSTEIDRPGSLSAHMNRCITLLMQVLRTTNDTKTLIDLCLNLRKAPEQDK